MEETKVKEVEPDDFLPESNLTYSASEWFRDTNANLNNALIPYSGLYEQYVNHYVHRFGVKNATYLTIIALLLSLAFIQKVSHTRHLKFLQDECTAELDHQRNESLSMTSSCAPLLQVLEDLQLGISSLSKPAGSGNCPDLQPRFNKIITDRFELGRQDGIQSASNAWKDKVREIREESEQTVHGLNANIQELKRELNEERKKTANLGSELEYSKKHRKQTADYVKRLEDELKKARQMNQNAAKAKSTTPAHAVDGIDMDGLIGLGMIGGLGLLAYLSSYIKWGTVMKWIWNQKTTLTLVGLSGVILFLLAKLGEAEKKVGRR